MLGPLLSAVTSVLTYTLVLLVLYWCWFQWNNWDLLQAARKLPNPYKVLPVFGHSYLLLCSWQDITRTAYEMSMQAISTGLYNIFFWCGPLPVLMVHKLEDIQKILTTSATSEKGDEMDFLKYYAENGLLNSPGSIWKITRRHITPLFHLRNVEQLMSLFNQNSRELVAELADHVDGEAVEMLYPTMTVALKTVCQLIFGPEIDFDVKSEGFKGLLKVVVTIPEYFLKRIIKPWLRLDFIFQFLYRKELAELDRLWKQFTESPLKIAKHNHKNKYGNGEIKFIENSELRQEGPLNLIDVYTELQRKYPQFTETDLKGEMITLYCTGSDTVGLTVATCLLVLGKYIDIQDRVVQEIDSVVGTEDDVTTDHVSRMQYLDQVIKETLRWSITVPYILRKTSEELKLSNCTIPPGNTVIVALIGPHMDPNIYPNPQKFDPERFSPENSTSRDRHSFIPFSTGPRMCIGKTYTEHLVKTMLVHVLRTYRVSTDIDIHNLKKVLVVTLVNSDGYPVRLTHRKSRN